MTTAPAAVPETPADHIPDIVTLPGERVTGIILVHGTVEGAVKHRDGTRTVTIRAAGAYSHEPVYAAVCEALGDTPRDALLEARLRPGSEAQFVLSATSGVLVLLDAVSPSSSPASALTMMVARLQEKTR